MRRWSGFTMTSTFFSALRFCSHFRKTRDVQMVPTVSSVGFEDECTGMKTGASTIVKSGDSDDGAGLDIIEVGAAEMEALPKTYRKTLPKESCLSTQERQRLTQMIFDAHYATEGNGKEDRAMWYQSALEVQWLEDWAAAGRSEKDVIRRAVKRAVLERVDLRKPLAYIIGYQPFYGCHIRCSPPLLCPRPETEMWTHWFVRHNLLPAMETVKMKATPTDSQKQQLRVLDMCCGTGCIGIAIAVHLPNAEIVAVDIMDEAVRASEENAKINGLDSKRYRAVKSDMFEVFFASAGGETRRGDGDEMRGASNLDVSHVGSFDCIVSNPPYVLPEQYVDLPLDIKLWESKLALVGDAKREDKQYLYFKELCEFGAALLKPKARRYTALINTSNFIVEVGLQAERVASIMERSGMWENVEIHLDYAQQMRWISASSSH